MHINKGKAKLRISPNFLMTFTKDRGIEIIPCSKMQYTSSILHGNTSMQLSFVKVIKILDEILSFAFPLLICIYKRLMMDLFYVSSLLKTRVFTNPVGELVNMNHRENQCAEYDIFIIWNFPQGLGLKVK